MCWCTLRLIRIVIHVCDLIVCSLPFLLPFRVFLLSLLLLPEPGLFPLPLPCGRHRGKIPLALRQLRSLALWPITRFSQFSPLQTTPVSCIDWKIGPRTVKLCWNSNNVNVHPVPRKLCRQRSSWTRAFARRCFSVPLHDDQNNTIVMERIWIGNLCWRAR